MKIARSRKSTFKTELLPILTSTIFIVATMAFVLIPWSVGTHPGETIAVVGNHSYHPS